MTYLQSLRGRHPEAGFTLVELMVVIVIATVLLSIAIPGSQAQIRKSRRTEARMAVLDLASREERFLSTANSYSQTTTDLGYTGTFPITTIGNGYYSLTVVAPAGATPPTFVVTATAIGQQLKDTACQTVTVNQLGTQAATDANGAAATTCWN